MLKKIKENRELWDVIIELTVGLLFGLVILVLGFKGYFKDDEKLLIALALWALVLPSPTRWVIRLGQWIAIYKNGSHITPPPPENHHPPQDSPKEDTHQEK